MLKLTGFQVQNFRSVADSGWIDTDDITALIGVNESGKTNLLLPLWKLNPANDGEIDPIPDYPRMHYGDIRDTLTKPTFITACFELPDILVRQIVTLTGAASQDVRTVKVSRDLGGKHHVSFALAQPIRSIAKTEVSDVLSQAHSDFSKMESVSIPEQELKALATATLEKTQPYVLDAAENLGMDVLNRVIEELQSLNLEKSPKRSLVGPRYGQIIDSLQEMTSRISKPHPDDNAEACDLVVSNLPSFVYYSNYGNLDSEIYLPHVIENLNRPDKGTRETAKARTLKVLFDFVKLKPEEILELGKDFNIAQRRPTEEEIEAINKKKKEREILLQSASTKLTEQFRDWWQQGEYQFRFQADGDHFRIWVSDEKRPEPIELEGRSTGLQWFLCFYLVFLVERAEAHKGAILLLDEPGLSLHPLAQEDLSRFFENLAVNNQLLYTTHSPFLVDPDHLDRVKAVYVDGHGKTVASANLRPSQGPLGQSIYAVHAAMGLSVSRTMLQGCQSVVVEGPSDQVYLSAIKVFLISQGKITPRREILFLPAGGVKGVGAVVSIVTGKEEALPFVVLDSDRSGNDFANKIKSNLYQGASDRILSTQSICGLENSEIEDLFPTDLMANVVTKFLRGPDEDFDEVLIAGQPIVPQIEQYADKYCIKLDDGWKVELARLVKERLLKDRDPMPEATLQQWAQLFLRIGSE